MKISEVLWIAANEKLACDEDHPYRQGKEVYSCCAISAASAACTGGYSVDAPAREFYEQYLKSNERDGDYLSGLSYREAQQVRYSMLMLVQQIAKEQGL